MTNTRSNRSKTALGAFGVALAAGLVLVPVAASAHVGVEADGSAAPGGETTLTFGFSHGCDGSPTTQLVVEMPDGLSGVHPVADPAWDIEIERGGDAGRVSTVTYTATEAIPDELRGEAEMVVGFADDAADALAFPVEQICEDGSTSWSEIAEDGQDPHELESPAPVLSLAGDDAAGHDHGGAASASGSPEDAAASEQPSQTLPITLGVVGVVLGAAGLVAGIAANRRRS